MDRTRWYRRLLAAGLVLLAGAGAATVWFGGGQHDPARRDCDTVLDLGRRSHDLGLWMNSADPSPDETVARQAELAAAVRAAVDTVHTPDLVPPLRIWADALDLDTELQRQAGGAGGNPQWLDDSYRVAAMTQDAVHTLDSACPGMRVAVRGD